MCSCMHACMHACMHDYTYVCMCMSVLLCVCVFACFFVCTVLIFVRRLSFSFRIGCSGAQLFVKLCGELGMYGVKG